MIKVFLIRHGHTGFEGRYKGRMDVPLVEQGVKDMQEAASALKRYLKGAGLDAIYCSGLIRAAKSAEIVAGAFGNLKVARLELLRERDFGKWEGMRYDEIAQKYPKEWARWVKDPFANNPAGGESSESLRRRSIAAMKEVLRAHADGDTVAVVTHSGIMRMIICRYLGLPYRKIFRLELDFGCLNLIELHGPSKTPLVKFVNWRPI